MFAPRSRDLSHVGSVELLTATPQETIDFFVRLMGMSVSGEAGDSVYVHAWDDYEKFTVKVTASSTSGIGRAYIRAAGPEALERRAAAVKDAGQDGTWVDGEMGLGPVFLTRDPDGHEIGLYFETEWYEPSAQWFHICDKSYDLVYTADWAGCRGRLHHIAFATDTREDILRAADVFLDAGIHIEAGARTSTRSSRPSSCMCGSPAATGSSCATPVPAWWLHRTGRRCRGRRPSGPRARP